ncbi:hypothetical protein HY605_06170 [Candidatus Peregrinibacteria bacterium]|nr:hypothetical protein [Candidatus Peregrinibacteria bacterium]
MNDMNNVNNMNKTSRANVGFTLTFTRNNRSDRGDSSNKDNMHQQTITSDILKNFPWISSESYTFGDLTLELWGHEDPSGTIWKAPDESIFVLIGSPDNLLSWDDFWKDYSQKQEENVSLPWEGRCILLKISPDKKNISVWTDWMGSIPIYYGSTSQKSVVSTLEPVAVSYLGLTPEHFLQRGLVELLLFGHFISTDTLYRDLFVVPPDSYALWKEGIFVHAKKMWSVVPSQNNWEKGWDELLHEFYHQTKAGLSLSFGKSDVWLIPLSSGMDSRLMAAFAREMNKAIETYTYGPATWDEVVYAKHVARALSLPWKRVDLGKDYLATYLPLWLQWFGTSLHAHGTYQMPFLETIKSTKIPLASGFIGDPLAGNHVNLMMQKGATPYEKFLNFSQLVKIDKLERILNVDVQKCLMEIADILTTAYESYRGAAFQKMMLLDYWHRQRRFIVYQSLMYSYFTDIATPFMNRNYARFCLSLPRSALDDRKLQKDLLKIFFPKLAEIAGSFSSTPLRLSKKYLLKRMFSQILPTTCCRGSLREFNTHPNTLDPDCVLQNSEGSLYPLNNETMTNMEKSGLFKSEGITWGIQQAKQGTWEGIEVCQTLIPIAMMYQQELKKP